MATRRKQWTSADHLTLAEDMKAKKTLEDISKNLSRTILSIKYSVGNVLYDTPEYKSGGIGALAAVYPKEYIDCMTLVKKAHIEPLDVTSTHKMSQDDLIIQQLTAGKSQSEIHTEQNIPAAKVVSSVKKFVKKQTSLGKSAEELLKEYPGLSGEIPTPEKKPREKKPRQTETLEDKLNNIVALLQKNNEKLEENSALLQKIDRQLGDASTLK